MNCLEFKRLALADPSSSQASFVEHGEHCAQCLRYVTELRQMDADLAASLAVEMPAELGAKLKLAQGMSLATKAGSGWSAVRYAVAATLLIAIVAVGFMVSTQRHQATVGQDYQQLLSAVVEHLNEEPMTPVWEAARANRTVNTLLASYDQGLRVKQLDNLQYSQICPMGKYRGLHATLETESGQITFAYIKGDSVGELFDTGYQGYLTRVKPIRGGNLVIISRTQRALDQADAELEKALYWDI